MHVSYNEMDFSLVYSEVYGNTYLTSIYHCLLKYRNFKNKSDKYLQYFGWNHSLCTMLQLIYFLSGLVSCAKLFLKFASNVWIISYSKCSNWRWISKFSWNFGCLFTCCYFDRTNSIKTNLQTCNSDWICIIQIAKHK